MVRLVLDPRWLCAALVVVATTGTDPLHAQVEMSAEAPSPVAYLQGQVIDSTINRSRNTTP